MANELMKRPTESGGMVPAVASAVVPGLGQLINSEKDKAIGVFGVFAGAGLLSWLLGWLPFIGWVPGAVLLFTWVYGIIDAHSTGKKK
ncbi:hypothetical protein [Haliangium ochraceum]|uniref:Uncharacterized protein n=1 Tax=Haliangium ochraceum (strain DSM 14365 / JCM 11303 / SMP-2) TaxID=502025 RepID=D0LVC5_HALO1|nr:hypothetical protein [Haliangium ochraceum]ACY17486.1 hypothetical protein Hoch_4997 [Haliangium ochraceum DSM 14365]